MCWRMLMILLYCHQQGVAYKLQELVHKCEVFAVSRDIPFNARKSVCMAFSPQRPNASAHLCLSQPPIVKLSGNNLTWVDEFRYLGHVINSKLRDDSDMRNLKRSLYYCVNMLCALVGYAKRELLVRLFKSYCTNLYGCGLWDTCKEKKDVSWTVRGLSFVCENNWLRCQSLSGIGVARPLRLRGQNLPPPKIFPKLS